jgi:DNA mismatch repair protein MutS2
MTLKFQRALEFDKILERLASHTAFSASDQLARSLEASTDHAEIARWQAETTEARSLLDQQPETTVGGARDVRPETQHARLGAMLSPMDLLEIRQTLLAARTLRRTLTRLNNLYPRLAVLASQIQEIPVVADTIARAVNDRGEIVDGASDELARIRRELNTTRSRLQDKLQKILASSTYAKFLQEAIITQREGRYVIPIRAEAKGRIQGIVHDTSASGATLFIEPLSTVEVGNRVVELVRAEEREIERVLRELTNLIAAHAEPIDWVVEALAEIDLALAKAKYSLEIRGVEPKIDFGDWKPDVGDRRASNLHPPSPKLQLVDARHPLLDPVAVVPISIHLGGEFSILIVTGPNTGGKTVALKTVGLLALMAQSGLHIPAREGSRLPLFSGIYADIGDEQSIEQSLSTFSSHLKNITGILHEADTRSLVLLDELGAGTDPVEGSALARAILSYLLERGIPALVATHYAELKAFAQTTPGVQNASVEFDLETLSPTYHLTIGLPGQSNAFAIATRLGLDPAIIERAHGTLATTDVEMEKLLADIKRSQQEALSSQAHAELAQRETEQLAAEARRKLAEIEKSQGEILERARLEAHAQVEQARAELESLREKWHAVSLTREFVESEHEMLNAVQERLKPPEPSIRPAPTGGEPVRAGDRVFVSRLGQFGEVIAQSDDGAEVQVGKFRVQVKLDELKHAQDMAPEREQVPSRVSVPDVESPGMEVSLRGLRADDALIQLEKYLDRAYLAGLPFVRIVHGKGTGTLRKLTRDLLREHPLVAEIREAAAHEGGEGVTIAKLVAR